MAYQYEKVNHELLVPQIEDQLMMYMKQENIAIGEKLPSEYKLAELFGVGRSTIREAVKSLVTKGVLEVKRGSGTYVRSTEMVAEDPLGLAQFEDKYRLAMELFEVRILLEPEVAAVASRNATEEEKQHIKELCDETERIYLEGKNHIPKDMEFHEAIAKCSGNRVFEVLVPIIYTAVTTFCQSDQQTAHEGDHRDPQSHHRCHPPGRQHGGKVCYDHASDLQSSETPGTDRTKRKVIRQVNAIK